MSRTADFILRGFYILAGLALIVYSLTATTARAPLYVPAIFGVLLIVQGFSGT